MDFKDINLHDLRAIARTLGVKCPSSYSKDVLVKKIIGVKSGIIEPHYTRSGRPVKKLDSVKPESLEAKKVSLMFRIEQLQEAINSLSDEIKEL